MRADRLLSILLLLEAHGRMSAPELARRLEVSVRTIYRDVEALSAAGAPVFATPGRGGGIQLVAGHEPRMTTLTAEEAEVLFLFGEPALFRDLGLARVAEAARLKLLASLPTVMQERARRALARLYLDAPGWETNEQTPHLVTLVRATWEDRRVEARYERNDGKIVSRALCPLGVVVKAGVWYLVASTDSAPRSYRISRFSDVHLTDDGFERDPRFDLAAYWHSSVDDWRDTRPDVEVSVRVSPEFRPHVLEALGERARAQLLDAPPDPAGGHVITLTYESFERAKRRLIGIGPGIEVVAPQTLRRSIRTELAALVTMYDGGAPVPTFRVPPRSKDLAE